MNITDRVVSKQRFFAHLRALAASKKTGTLIVTEPGIERRLYFEGGAIVAATSNLREESMGYLLAERDIVKANKVAQAEELMGNKSSLLGRRLVELGAMSEDEVGNAVRLKVRETISSILASPEAEITLNDETFPEVDRVPVSVDVDRLLAAGIEAAEKKVAPIDTEETLVPESTEETLALEPEPEKTLVPPVERTLVPPLDETDDPDNHLIEALEGFTEKYSREATTGPRTQGPITRPYPAAPGPRTGSHRRPARTAGPPMALIAAGVAGVVLLGGGYWFFTRAPEESARTVADRTAAPSVTDTELPSEPPQVPETAAEPASNAAKPRSTPTPSSSRPSPAPAREPVSTSASRQARPAPAAAAPIQTAPAPATPKPAPAPPRAEKPTPRAAPSQREPAPEPQTKSSNTETGRSGSESSAQPSQPAPAPSPSAGQVQPAQPAQPTQQAQPTQPAPQSQPDQQTQPPQQAQEGAPGNWGSAVFAPKQASVSATPKSGPALQTGDYVEPSFDVIEPVLIEHPKLKYPDEAKRQKIPEAVVRVRVLVDHTGAVVDAEIVRSAGHGFDEIALATASQARFIPATKDHVKVKTWTVLPLVFRLED